MLTGQAFEFQTPYDTRFRNQMFKSFAQISHNIKSGAVGKVYWTALQDIFLIRFTLITFCSHCEFIKTRNIFIRFLSKKRCSIVTAFITSHLQFSFYSLQFQYEWQRSEAKNVTRFWKNSPWEKKNRFKGKKRINSITKNIKFWLHKQFFLTL